MPEIRRSSDKGKEIVNSLAKKTDFIKREAQEKLTLRKENEHLLGGADKGESSNKRQKTTEQQTNSEPSEESIGRFFAGLRTIKAIGDIIKAEHRARETERTRRESQRQSTSQPWKPTFIKEDFKEPDKSSEK